jgi:pimeloyl-ACP methyl ester carboxylesterase
MKQIVQYKNEYSLSYAEYGDKKGYPILVQHGLVASITDYHLFDRLIQFGIRLICIARPGYGESSRYEMKNMAEWGEIVAVLVDELRLPDFDVLGMSSGAPYSYSIGYKFPEKARNIFIFSGTPALYADAVLALWPYPVNKTAGIPELEKLAHDLFFSNPAEEDLARADIKDSMMNNGFGIAQDLKLRCVDWGFKLSDVKQTVYMQHSREDSQVPFAAAELTAKLLPNCRFELRAHGEHFSSERLEEFFRTIMSVHQALYNSRHD